MSYRPKISDEVHKRVQICNAGETSVHNHTYEEAVKLFIAPDGEEREWVKRCMQLAEGEDLDDVQSINQVVTSLLDADGKFKPGAKQLFERRETVGED